MKYIITITDNFFPPLTGTFEAENKEMAEKEAKEYYAHELDTFPENIEIIKSELIN